MTIIEGRDEILNFVLKELEQSWKILRLNYSKVKGKIIFAVIFLLNNKYNPKADSDIPDDNLSWTRTMIRTLDVLLKRGWNSVDLRLTDEELKKYTSIVLTKFSKLGKLWDLFLECKAFNVEKHVVEEGQCISDSTIRLDAGFGEWSESRLDKEWFDYPSSSKKREKRLLEVLNKEMKKKYGVTLEFFYRMGLKIENGIRKELGQTGKGIAAISCIPEPQLLGFIHTLDPTLDEKVFISHLEYQDGGEWMRTPFVRLKDNSTHDSVYFLLTSAFYPFNYFAMSWWYSVPRTVKNSSALGIMGNEWGIDFEKYVRAKLRKCHQPHLKIHSGTTTIKRSDYPDILDCIGKPEIEIDVVASSDERVYLISCKTGDQFTGIKMIGTLLRATYHEFEQRLMKDIKDVDEIERIAYCIRRSRNYLESMGFENKEIVPVLMTSDVRPLSIDSVREWAIKVMIMNTLPNARIIQAMDIDEYPFT